MTSFPPATRAAALERLDSFLPKAGKHYAQNRNTDFGPNETQATSLLSPHVRHRLVTEEEIVAHVLKKFGPNGAEKFVQEVVWRTYWKGYLEMRPTLWEDYRYERTELWARYESDADFRERLDEALEGRTGIICFDAWVAELKENNWLHNHTRMWFASIWVFTLNLPWELGADFFYHHLLDGDAASNTLSWRWVAGLHTAGKAYLATPSNIERYTNGRFKPGNRQLADDTGRLEELDKPPAQDLDLPLFAQDKKPFALLIHNDDCAPDLLDVDWSHLTHTITVPTENHRTALPGHDHGAATAVLTFEKEALADAAARIQEKADKPVTALDFVDGLAGFVKTEGIETIITPTIPQGTARDALRPVLNGLQDGGVAIHPVTRPWDRTIWPHATAGFFKVKKKLPKLLGQLQLR
ncbi:MAG: FAD-binding domain-containing protein [Pseudomonadota bacterium]